MSTGSDVSFARDVLRRYHTELLDRLQPETLVPWLYERGIISDTDKEKIQSRRRRWKKAERLLEVMKTRSRAEAFLFARKLSQTKGIQDLGLKILSEAGEDGISMLLLHRTASICVVDC